MITRITSLATCHNRRGLTLACLERLQEQIRSNEIQITIVLVDDGSKDGTGNEVAEKFPNARILAGPGDLYWCGGMRLAWKEAAREDPDYYLLLNDDTMLAPHALKTLLELTGSPDAEVIAVATIADSESGEVIYGGISRGKGILSPSDTEPCETFNANCVLVPRAVFRRVGSLHHAYTHSMGDIDYGFQASRLGVVIKKSTEFLGTCGSNSITGTWQDRSLPIRTRMKLLQHPKGLPFREWVVFCKRNMGFMWPYRCISPFLRILARR